MKFLLLTVFFILSANVSADTCRLDSLTRLNELDQIEELSGFIQADDVYPSETQAHEKAKNENKFALIIMGASWCYPCRMLKQNVLPTDRFKVMLEQQELSFGFADFSNRDNISALKNRYIRQFGASVPKIILLSPNGIKKLERGEPLAAKDYRLMEARSFHDGEGALRDNGTEIIPLDEEIARAKVTILSLSTP